jgi:predicted phage baseplate assembly protein
MNEICGCCDGITQITPVATANRPGLNALAYRVGTHAAFLETMKARLSNFYLDIQKKELGAGGQPQFERIYPLRGLTTRTDDDPSIALLDAWAIVGDVLTFYQERIANEGYLRTATERRSILELARLVGYTLRPGVAATVYLAYTLDSNFKDEVIIPAGARAQSVPGPGELPQSFETSEPLTARASWNALKPRMAKPQKIMLGDAQQVANVYFDGTALSLKPNDRLLFVFGEEPSEQVMRNVQEARAQFDEKRTEVTLHAVPFLVVAAVALLRTAKAALDHQIQLITPDPSTESLIEGMERVRDRVQTVIENLVLGNYPPIDAAYFSHDRIYGFQTRIAALARLAVAVPRDAINQLFSGPPRTGARRRGAAITTGNISWQDPHILIVVGVVLGQVQGMLQDASFRHELVCFASSVVQQARPTSTLDKRFIGSLLAQAAEQKLPEQFMAALQNLQTTQKDQNLEKIRQKALAVLDEFTKLLRAAELHDNLNDMLSDLLEVSKAMELNSTSDFIQKAQDWLNAMPKGADVGCEPAAVATSLNELIVPLAKPPSLHPASSAQLARTAVDSFKQRADNIPQLLVALEPRLREMLYRAWANAAVNPSPSPLKSVHVLRLMAPPFGYNAPFKMGITQNTNDATKEQFPFLSQPNGDSKPSEAGDERPERLYLDAAYDAILPQSYIVIRKVGTLYLAARVDEALTRPRTAYNISGKTTQLTLSRAWWNPTQDTMDKLRGTTVYAQSEELFLAEALYTADIQDQHIELNELYDGLVSGRWLIVSGERTDVQGATGVKGSELVMLSAVEQGFDADLPGDKTRTTITIANTLAYRYKRDTVTIYGNVVKATHGETRNEVLGSGDGSQALQSFTLKQPPLTFVAATNPRGVDSTLLVRVNDIEWHESDTLADLQPTDRKFITRTDDDSKTSVIFGNGQQGARLPTGIENVKAVYRNGIGKPGNVKAAQISLLATRPLGVKEVINPLRASGGADRERRDQARKNAPLAVIALDRLVSTQDYQDFTRTFAGIGKASAAHLTDGRRQVVFVTIAGADDIPIDKSSDLYRNLVKALRQFGDPQQPVQVELRELLLIVISANVRLLPDYLWEAVVPKIRAQLLDTFSFERRELAQDVVLSEVISVIQAVDGVAYVDVDLLGAVHEKKSDHGERRLLTPDEIAAEVQQQIDDSQVKGPRQRITVNVAGAETKTNPISPAQLAFLTPDVPATLILNQIK